MNLGLLRRRDNENDYVKNGLIFHLDGRDSNGSTWIDRIGNVTYTLYGCARNGKGVEFLTYRSSYGETNQAVQVSPNVGTIEVVANVRIDDNTKYQLTWSGGGTSMILYLRTDYIYIALSTPSTVYKPLTNMPELKTMSFNSVRAYCNLVEQEKNGNTDKASSVQNAFSRIGAVLPSAPYFKGIIYQVRLYNRILSEEEILHNQHLDIDLYNIPT